MKTILVILILCISLFVACDTPSTPTEEVITIPATPVSGTALPSSKSTPDQTPEILNHKITLMSCDSNLSGVFTGHEQLGFSGEVRNDSQTVLEDMEVIIKIYDKNDKILGVCNDTITPWQISPSETGRFSMAVDIFISAWYYEVSFRLPTTNNIEVECAPGVGTLWEIHPNY